MEDLAGRRKTLERERLRLEKLLGQHPQWRMMRAAGETPALVDGAWQFPGLNRVQASALRESLVFRAYRDVVDQLSKLDERRDRAQVRSGREDGSETAGSAQPAKPVRREPSAVERAGGAGEGSASRPDPAPVVAPQPAFRTKVKIKPVARPGMTGAADRPSGGDERGAARDISVAGGPTGELVQTRDEPRDDLTRIRSINRTLAAALAEARVVSFQQIAAWNGDEVRRIADDLDLGPRIWREGWIEQAAALILKRGGVVPEISGRAPKRDRLPRAVVAVSEPVDRADAPGDAAAVGQVTVPPRNPEPEVGDKAGVVPRAQLVPATLALPIARLAKRPEAMPADELGPSDDALGDTGDGPPVAAVAQASETAPTVDETAETAAATECVAEPIAATASETETETEPELRSVGRGTSHKVGRNPQRLPAPSVRRLTYIRGLTDDMAERLRASGVRSLKEIADWRAGDVEWFKAILGEEARISADQWIEQAEVLAQGRWTAYALDLVRGRVPPVVARPAPLVRCLADSVEAIGSIDAEGAGAGVREDVEAGDAAAAVAVEPATPDHAEAVAARADDAGGPGGLPAREMSELGVKPSTAAGDGAVPEETGEPRSAEPEPSAEAGDEMPSGEVVSPMPAAAPELPARSKAAVLVAPIVVPFVPLKRSLPAVQQERGDVPGGDAGPSGKAAPDAAPARTGDADGRDAQAGVSAEENAAAQQVGPPGGAYDLAAPARPAASLFADDLVEKLTSQPTSLSGRRVLPELPRALNNGADGARAQVEADGDILPEAVSGGQAEAMPVDMAEAETEAVEVPVPLAQETPISLDPSGADDLLHARDDRYDQGWDADDEVVIVRADDDVADAEALVVKRSPSCPESMAEAPAETAEMPPPVPDAWAVAQARGSRRASGSAEAGDRLRDEALDDTAGGAGEGDGFAPLGEEASVQIVLRRADGVEPPVIAEPGQSAGHDVREAGLDDSPERQRGARQRLGFSPEFLVRRMEQGEGESDEDYAGYRDEVEEATVTIIRAKGQAEPESSIMPERIANDLSSVVDAARGNGEEPAEEASAKQPGLGSRFLKALTGD
jgi:predicted flap endonuclease-1-like 5' DNA nuclease